MPNDLRAVALEAVRHASSLCREVQARLVGADTLTKGDRSPVTIADYGAQAIVSLVLRSHDAEVAIVGEENADVLRNDESTALRAQVTAAVRSVDGFADVKEDQVLDAIDACSDEGGAVGRRWVLDPIDGTKGYLRGDQYAVALGLLEEGEVTLGALGCPNLESFDGSAGTLFLASRGDGCTEFALDSGHSRAANVTQLSDASRANFCESVESAHSAHDRHQLIAQVLGTDAEPFRIDSQCKYGAVARGQASIYLRLPRTASYQEKIWDHAAGAIVVREAGGRVTDVEGKDLDFTRGRTLERNRGIVATNGRLHEDVLEAIRRTEP